MIVSTGARAITWMNPPGIGRGIAFAVRRSSSQSAGLSKTVALVTGAGSGLGAATARALLGRGARVVVADLSVDALQRDPYFSQFIVVGSGSLPSPAEGPAVTFCPTNVTDPGQVSRALDLAESMYGEPVNAAICCAGIATAEKTVGRRGAHSLESFRSVVEVNLLGSFNVARLAAERMSVRENQTAEQPNQDMNGCIIFTASIAAYDGQVGQVAYAASKAGLVGMTLPMARDLAPHRIRVMTIAPGLFSTPLLDGLPEAVKNELGRSPPCPNRLGDPAEFGRLVCSVLENDYLNGEVIRLDGALRMPP